MNEAVFFAINLKRDNIFFVSPTVCYKTLRVFATLQIRKAIYIRNLDLLKYFYSYRVSNFEKKSSLKECDVVHI